MSLSSTSSKKSKVCQLSGVALSQPLFPDNGRPQPIFRRSGVAPNLCLDLYRPVCVALTNKAHKTQLT